MSSEGPVHEESAYFLAEAAKVFASTLDHERILKDIAKLVVPKLADWCTIDLIEDGTPRTVVTAHSDPMKQAFAQKWRLKWPINPRGPLGSPRVMLTGRSEIYPVVEPATLRAATLNDEHYDAAVNLKICSMMIVPLKSHSEVFGALTFIAAESEREYTDDDLKLAEEIGRSAGTAIENALLYRRARLSQERAEKSEKLLRVTTDRLLENEERFRRLAEAVPHLTWTSLPSGEIDYFNGRWIEYTGVTPKDSVAYWTSIIHPDQVKEVLLTWKDCFASQKTFESEFLVRSVNGAYEWHLARAVPSRDSAGNILRWFGTWTNIDAQKRQEDRLLKLQEITAALSRAVTPAQVAGCVHRNKEMFLAASSVAMMVLSDDHSVLKVLRSNGELQHFFEQSPHGLTVDLSMPFGEAVRTQQPLFFESGASLSERYREGREALTNLPCALAVIPLVFQGLSLGVLALCFSAAKVFSSEDRSFLVSSGQQCAQALERSRLFEGELNARHRAEDAQYRLRFLSDASTQLVETLELKKITTKIVEFTVPPFADGAAVVLTNENGDLECVSSANIDGAKDAALRDFFRAEKFNLNTDTLFTQVLKQGKSLFFADRNDGLFYSIAKTVDAKHLDKISALGIRSMIVARLGIREVTSGLLIFFTSDSGRLFRRDDLNMAEELARRTSMALENSRLYDAAQKAVNIRDEFLSIASHELKTPLTSIKLQLQIMNRMREQNKAEALIEKRMDRALEVFDSQSDRLAKLVDSLLDISKIQAGRLSIEPERVNLSALVKQVVERFAIQFAAVRCIVEMNFDERIEGYWDRMRLEQVITNLITNAIKYGAEHPIQVRTFSRNENAYIAVQDSGIGIAPADQGRIFNRFERAVADRKTWGLGLGLYISRQIVESHQGRIHLQSEKGRGSTFTVELPLHKLKTPTRVASLDAMH